eukprot:scaffold27990_cov57-Attheya_sp.AAC.1
MSFAFLTTPKIITELKEVQPRMPPASLKPTATWTLMPPWDTKNPPPSHHRNKVPHLPPCWRIFPNNWPTYTPHPKHDHLPVPLRLPVPCRATLVRLEMTMLVTTTRNHGKSGLLIGRWCDIVAAAL